MALTFERALYWGLTNRPGRTAWLSRLSDRLRAGDWSAARAVIARDGSIYGRVISSLLDRKPSEAALLELIENERSGIERFVMSFSTIITAAPLLGILGTVLGIIESFEILGAAAGDPISDPTKVAGGIAKALITTAFGLIISAGTLFPSMFTRASVERCISRLEGLGAAAIQGVDKRNGNAAQHRISKSAAPQLSGTEKEH